MSTIREVQISGLWQQRRELAFELHRDVNFLIGVNGSGKTTVLNLIAAALTADLSYFEKAQFSQIRLSLVESGDGGEHILTVDKDVGDDGVSRIFYAIQSKDEDIALKRRPVIDSRLAFRSSAGLPVTKTSITRNLALLSRTTWLSIHRLPAAKRDERSFESTVDGKLSSIGAELVRFFSEIASKGEAAARYFQQQVFTSLVPDFENFDIVPVVMGLNIEEAESSLTNALSEFGVSPAHEKLHRYFEYLKQAQDHFRKPRPADSTLTFEQSAALMVAQVINKIVGEWNILKEEQQIIAEPRETYLNLLSSLSIRKRFFISAKNELRVQIKGTEGDFSLAVLSSGEKQLVIILGEALLQRKREAIYVADEPELSLHVSWQEKLIDMLRQINPESQIIFATHSPDIVAHYQSRVFDMEKMLA